MQVYFAADSRMAAERLRAAARSVELGLGAGGVGGVDGFVDAGDDDGGVAGELAGSVDGVAVPGAFGEAFGVEEGGLGVAQGLVERGGVGGRVGLAAADGGSGGGEAFGGGEGGGEVDLGGRYEFGHGAGVDAVAGLGAGLAVEVADDLFAVEVVVVGEDVGVGHVEELRGRRRGPAAARRRRWGRRTW